MNKLYLLLLLCGLASSLFGQDCAPSQACFNAPLICGNALNGLTAVTGESNDITQPAEFCGVIENNNWIRFTACEATVSLGFEVFSCEGTFTGTGIQAEIFATSDCQSFVSVSDCYSSSDASGGTLTATGLTPGQDYFLMTDGWAGDICEYQINVLGGIDTTPPTPQQISPGNISGPAVVCPGETVTYIAVLPQCDNTAGSGCPLPVLPASDFTFAWNLPPDAALQSAESNIITVTWGSTGGTIAVEVTESATVSACACDYSCGTEIPPLSVEVDNEPDEVTTLPPVYLCAGESYEYCGEVYTESADAQCTTSCETAEIQPIIFLEETVEDSGIITNCNGDCYEINGEVFCDPGDYTVTEQTPDGCTTFVFSIENTDLTGFAQGGEVLTPGNPTTQIEANGYSVNEPVSYQWEGPGINADNADEQNPEVGLPGTYTVTITDASGACSIEFEVIVYQQDDDCNLPVPPADDCVLAPVFCGEQLDGYCSHTEGYSGTVNDPAATAFCEPIEQSQYLRFVACESEVILEINVPTCQSGTGIEAALLAGECTDMTPAGDCAVLLENDTLSLTASDLTPGEMYFLVIDGIDNAECTWEVAVVAGISTDPVELEEVSEAYIEGNAQVCRGDTTDYLLFPKECNLINGCPALNTLTDSFAVTWYYPPEAVLTDSTGLGISLAWPEGAGGTVSAVFISAFGAAGTNCGNEVECSGSAEFYTEVLYEEVYLPTVYKCVGESFVFCGETVTDDALLSCVDGCNLTFQAVEFSAPTVIDQDTIFLCPGDCYTLDGSDYCEAGYYEVETVNDVCPDIYRFTVAVIEEADITVEALETSCDGTGTNYIVGFDITDGVAPFFLNGFPLQNTNFISNPILSGESYSYLITDSRICGADEELIMGADTCACTSSAGTMQPDPLYACTDNALTVSHLQDDIQDADDNFEYILHLSAVDTLGEIFAISKEPEFNFLPTMTLGTTYYVSYVVANEIDGGFIDLSDRCLSVAPGQPVVWYAPPTAEIEPPQTLNCHNPAVLLSAETSNGSPVEPEYLWTYPDGQIYTEANPLITQAGIYTLLLTDPLTGCTTVADVQVTDDFTPPEIFLAGSLTDCNNPSTEITVTANVPDISVQWLDQNAVPIGNTPTVVGSFPGIYTAQVTGLNGCTSEGVYTVRGDFAAPEVTVTGGTLDCAAPVLQLTSQVNTDSVSYAWTGPNFTSDSAAPFADAAGDYLLTVTDTTNGCTATAAAAVLDNMDYPAAAAAADTLLTCSRTSVTLLSAGSSTGAEYLYVWTSAAGQPIDNAQSETATAFAPGIYVLTVTDTVNACSSTAEAEVLAETDIPVAMEADILPPTCYGDADAELIIGGVTGGIAPLTYTFNGQPAGENPQFFNLTAGSYTVTAEDVNGCILEESYLIDNPPLVRTEAGPDRFIDYGEVVYPQPVVTIDPTTVHWESTEGEVYEVLNPAFSPFVTTEYYLHITDAVGCADSDTLKIYVNREVPVFVPSAFSPDFDGINDVLTVLTGDAVSEITRFSIYDRWGNQIFALQNFPPNDPDFGWDGSYKDRPTTAGVYVWVLRVRLTDGTFADFAGDVGLMR